MKIVTFFVALLMMFFSVSDADADACNPSPTPRGKPSLTGEIDDGTDSLKFKWISSAGAVTSYGMDSWRIENAVCNHGKLNLVVTWEKASIFATAIRPLPPRASIVNSYGSGQDEPVSARSEIKYGLRGDPTPAHVYEVRQQAAARPPLHSLLEAHYAVVPDGPAVTNEVLAQTYAYESVRYEFVATAEKGGFDFVFYPKTEDARFVWVAISPPEIEPLAAGIAKAGIKVQVSPLNKFAKSIPADWPATMANAEYVIVPPRGDYSVVKAFISTEPRQISFANVVLLDKGRVPVIAGRIALYRN